MWVCLVPLLLFITSTAASGAEASPPREFRRALPGYKFKFPDDHRSHNEFKTEWWYYTGHLQSDDRKDFGFELTFFRSGLDTSKQVQNSRWSVDNVYLAHFAVSDLDKKTFFFRSNTSRPGVATGGADQSKYSVWNAGWSAKLEGTKSHVLKASTPEYAIKLTLSPAKVPIIHGKDGVSQKASCKGCASHYYSMTRMNASGELTRDSKSIPVTGLVWMDHEFGSNQLTKEQIGWDWFSVQLADNSELMLYRMRLKAGGYDQNSSGTIVAPDGKSQHLNVSDYNIEVLKNWKSSATGANYPASWRITIPSHKVDLRIVPSLDNQELVGEQAGGITYWEGACKVTGTKDGAPVDGQAYVELTGYAKDFTSDI